MTLSTDPEEVAKIMLSWIDLELVSCIQLQNLWAGYGRICALEARPAKTRRAGIPSSWQPFSKNGRVFLIMKFISPGGKTLDADEGHLRKMLSYSVEQYFYDQVAPRLGHESPVAQCLASTSSMRDRASRDGFENLTATIMSDLRLQYPVAGEKRSTLSSRQVEACLDWLAGFHAASWSLIPAKKANFLLPPLEEAKRTEKGGGLWLNGGYTYLATRRDEYASLSRDRSSEWHDAFCVPTDGPGSESVAEKVARFLTPSGREFETYIHGDVKSENLFSTTAGDQVAFYDFQYVGLGLGVCDLAKLFTCSVPLDMLVEKMPKGPKQRLGMSDGEKRLLERYRTALMSGRPKGMSFDYGWDEFVRHWEAVLVDWCRFQASWGFWGNTAWLQARVRNILSDQGWQDWLDEQQ